MLVQPWPPDLTALRTGDSAALEQLSQAYGDRLYRLALGLLGDPQAPEAAGLALAERGLRLAVAGGLVTLGVLAGPSSPLIVIGGVIGFLAGRDRCPIWQAVSPRLTQALHHLRPGGRTDGGGGA